MISLIRIQAQEEPEKLWNNILANTNKLQEKLGDKGKILYLAKRYKHNEATLFVHTSDTMILGDFIVEQLTRLEGVTGIWLINMLKPIFFPLPKGARRVKRYTVTVAAFLPRLAEIYERISQLTYPDGIFITYLANTCHSYGDCLQFSLLAENEGDLRKFISQVVDKIPGVLRTTLCEVEKNKPFISYEQWQKYASSRPFLEGWDEKHMVAQFNDT
jgi:hypothetical protein